MGSELLTALSKPSRFNQQKEEFLKKIYRFHRSINNVTLQSDLSTREGLLEIKEYAGDRMRDTIDILLKSFQEIDPAGYEALVKTITAVSIKKKAKKGIVRNMLAILGSISLDADETNDRLKTVLDRFGIHVEGNILDEVLERTKHIEDDEEAEREIEAFLYAILEGAAFSRRSGKLSVDIVSRLLGEEYKSMQEEMSKYEFVEEDVEDGDGVETANFRFDISKRRAHAIAGLNSGVCVAVDEKLWEKEAFSNVIMWGDEDGKEIAMGGMHFEVVEDEGKKFLSLPGINPNLLALSTVDPEKLYDKMIEFAKESARAIGAEAVLIPKNAVIHSNRSEIQAVISSKEYGTHSLSQEHAFSYDPYEYSWQDAYVVEL